MSSEPSHFNSNVSWATYTKLVSLLFVCILILYTNFFQVLLGGETAEACALLDFPEGGAVVLAERLCGAPHAGSNCRSVSPRSSVQTGPGPSRRAAAMSPTCQPAVL